MSRLTNMFDWVARNLGVSFDIDLSDMQITDQELMADLQYGRDDDEPPAATRSGKVEAEEVDELPDKSKIEFDETDEGGQFGKGINKIKATTIYRPSKPFEAPGSGFKDICPSQSHVNRRIVEKKLEAGLPATPVIPVFVSQKGIMMMTDKHHTFVACMAVGRPVKLSLLQWGVVGIGGESSSWKGCTWKGFEKPQNAANCFVLSSEDAEEQEGETTPNPDWKSIVPWRKNTPPTDKGKLDAIRESFASLEMGDALEQSIAADPTLASKLYEITTVDTVQFKARDAEEGSSGGDWDPETSTVYVDRGLDPTATADMLVFESLNAVHAGEYSELQHRAHRTKLDVASFGDERAKIEATVTIEYIEHLLARRAAKLPIAANGELALKAANKRIPGYLEMDAKTRASKKDELVNLIINTPHGGPTKVLPDRLALSTREIYAYEKAVDTQGVKGIIAYLDGLVPKFAAKRAAFFKVLKSIPTEPTDPSSAGRFFELATQAANDIYGLKIPAFTPAQLAVSAAEYKASGATWEAGLKGELEKLKV